MGDFERTRGTMEHSIKGIEHFWGIKYWSMYWYVAAKLRKLELSQTRVQPTVPEWESGYIDDMSIIRIPTKYGDQLVQLHHHIHASFMLAS